LKQGAAVLVDARRDPASPPEAADELLLFNANGSFPEDNGKMTALDAFLRQRLDSTKYNIVIVNRVDGASAYTVAARHCTIINATATGPLYAHEVGHGLGLATKGYLLNGMHDFGPWPAQWTEDARLLQLPLPTALMYPETSRNTINWIRAKDWVLANSKAAALE